MISGFPIDLITTVPLGLGAQISGQKIGSISYAFDSKLRFHLYGQGLLYFYESILLFGYPFLSIFANYFQSKKLLFRQ